jgi:hypothetical protein
MALVPPDVFSSVGRFRLTMSIELSVMDESAANQKSPSSLTTSGG